jgi:hypothetical protein
MVEDVRIKAGHNKPFVGGKICIVLERGLICVLIINLLMLEGWWTIGKIHCFEMIDCWNAILFILDLIEFYLSLDKNIIVAKLNRLGWSVEG